MSFQKSFKALSDPTRRKILDLLKNGEKSAGEICSHFSMTNATISHHLTVLREADLIYDQKEGKYIYYGLNLSVVEQIMTWLENLGGNSDEK